MKISILTVLALSFATGAFAQESSSADCRVAFIGPTESNHKEIYDVKAIRSKGYEIVDFNDIKTEEASNFYMRQVSYCGESKDDLKKVERSSDCEGTLLKAVGVEIISADESFKTEVLSAPFKKPRYTYQFQSFGLEEKILNFPSITRYHQAHRKFVKRSLEASKRIPHCNDLRI